MDLVTSLPTTPRGFDAIFTIVDRFSKMVRFIPTKTSSSAEEIAKLFFDHYVCKFGMPRKIVSDRDPRFVSRFWTALLRKLGCQ